MVDEQHFDRHAFAIVVSAHGFEFGLSKKKPRGVLLDDPIPVYEQDLEGERRLVYYGETDLRRLLAVIVPERGGNIGVVTATISRDAYRENDFREQENAEDAKVRE